MTIAAQIMELRRMTVGELREKYREVFDEDTNSRNKDWLWRRIAWRIQELEFGGISERARRRAAELANETDLRVAPPKDAFKDIDNIAKLIPNSSRGDNASKSIADPRIPSIGTEITKKFKGQDITVKVFGQNSFEYNGVFYKSLAAIAREITGSNYNGFLFFGLNKKDNKNGKK